MSELAPGATHAPRSGDRGRRASLVDEAYGRIKGRILDNSMPPGFQALEQELAAELGMSRTPLHEALIRLSEEGLVRITPRRGMQVLAVSPEDMREIYELLCCLEPAAVERLAGDIAGEADATLEAMERAIRVMEAALERDDLDAWAAADERFHAALLEGCGNRRLARIAFTVWDQVHRARIVTLRLRPKPVASTADHRAVLEAIRRREPENARELHRAHRRRGMQTLLGILENYRLTQL